MHVFKNFPRQGYRRETSLITRRKTDHNSVDAFLELESPGVGRSDGCLDRQLRQRVFSSVHYMLEVGFPGFVVFIQGRDVVEVDVLVIAITIAIDGVTVVGVGSPIISQVPADWAAPLAAAPGCGLVDVAHRSHLTGGVSAGELCSAGHFLRASFC